MLLCCRLETAYEALRQIHARFSSSSDLWKVSVAQLDFLLRGKRLHTALAHVEDIIVGKLAQQCLDSSYFCHVYSAVCVDLSTCSVHTGIISE